MTNRFAVIGLGHFGMAVARNLASRGAEVLAIDKDISRVDLVKDEVAYAVSLDATDMRALKSQNLGDMDAVLVAIGENIEGLLLTTVQLIELNTTRIIARAMTDQQRLILEKLGVREILSPEDMVGKLVAEMLLNPKMKSYLPLPDDYAIVEIETPKRIMNRSIEQIAFEQNYNIRLITIKRRYEEIQDGHKTFAEHLVRDPQPDTMVETSDVLIVIGKNYDIEKFVELNR